MLTPEAEARLERRFAAQREAAGLRVLRSPHRGAGEGVRAATEGKPRLLTAGAQVQTLHLCTS
jgi:hypothetical protein